MTPVTIGSLAAAVTGIFTAIGALIKLHLERKKVDLEEKSLSQQQLESALLTVQSVNKAVKGELEERIDRIVADHKQCEADLLVEQTRGRERDVQMETQRFTVIAQGREIEELKQQVLELQEAR
jgi:hypothetical protein